MGKATLTQSHLVGCLSLAVFELRKKKVLLHFWKTLLQKVLHFRTSPTSHVFAHLLKLSLGLFFFSGAERADRFQGCSQLQIVCLPPIFLEVAEALSFGLYLPEMLVEFQNPIPFGKALQDSSQALKLTLSRTTPETQKRSWCVLALEYPQIPSILRTEPLF